jgi:hypothetical protein
LQEKMKETQKTVGKVKFLDTQMIVEKAKRRKTHQIVIIHIR